MSRTKQARSAEVDELWGRTSYLISQAHGLEAFGEMSRARWEWLSAAQWAERLAELLRSEGVEDEAAQQQVSAASCYAKAGAFDRAVDLLEDLLARPTAPEAWRQEAAALLPQYREQMRRKQEARMTQQRLRPAPISTLGGYRYAHAYAA